MGAIFAGGGIAYAGYEVGDKMVKSSQIMKKAVDESRVEFRNGVKALENIASRGEDCIDRNVEAIRETFSEYHVVATAAVRSIDNVSAMGREFAIVIAEMPDRMGEAVRSCLLLAADQAKLCVDDINEKALKQQTFFFTNLHMIIFGVFIAVLSAFLLLTEPNSNVGLFHVIRLLAKLLNQNQNTFILAALMGGGLRYAKFYQDLHNTKDWTVKMRNLLAGSAMPSSSSSVPSSVLPTGVPVRISVDRRAVFGFADMILSIHGKDDMHVRREDIWTIRDAKYNSMFLLTKLADGSYHIRVHAGADFGHGGQYLSVHGSACQLHVRDGDHWVTTDAKYNSRWRIVQDTELNAYNIYLHERADLGHSSKYLGVREADHKKDRLHVRKYDDVQVFNSLWAIAAVEV